MSRISVKRRRQRQPMKLSPAVLEAMALVDQERTAEVVQDLTDRGEVEAGERETSEAS